MISRAGSLVVVVAVTAACGSRRDRSAPAARDGAVAAHDAAAAALAPADAAPAVDPDLARRIAAAAASSDPYVRWLLGPAGAAEPAAPEPVAAVLAAATIAPRALDARPPDWMREPTALTVTWRVSAESKEPACAAIAAAVGDALRAAGYADAPPSGDEQAAYARQADGVARRVGLACAEPSARPGCTGDCSSRGTGVALTVSMSIAAPPYSDVASALAPFPPLAAAIHARVLPAFLEQRVATRPILRLDCERARAGACEGDFAVTLAPPPDPKAWILDTIELARPHHFRCDETYKDPARDWIGSTQECSGEVLYYHLERGELWVRLSPILGAAVTADPVACSDRPPPPDAGPADPGVVTIMDMPVTRRAVDHLDQLAACYARHQQDAGRAATTGSWRRLGDFLERHVTDSASGLDLTLSTEHHQGDPPADRFHFRTRRPLPDGGAVELYAAQDSFEQSWGRVVLTVTTAQGAKAYEVQGTPDDLVSQAALVAFVRRGLDYAASEDARRVGKVEECRVLANRGQDCEWRDATADEQAKAKADIAARTTQLEADLDANAAALYAVVADMYPFGDPACALLLPGAPR